MTEELTEAIRETLLGARAEANSRLEMCAKCEPIFARLTPELVRACLVRDCDVLVYNLSRQMTLEFIALAKAGDWSKTINPSYPDKMDYTAVIDGITFQIYGTQPPPSCRIVEEEIEVPAHKTMKRTLVCK